MKMKQKESDLLKITAIAKEVIESDGLLLLDFLMKDEAAMLAMMIYVSRDSVAKFAYDFDHSIKVVVDQNELMVEFQGLHGTSSQIRSFKEYTNVTDDLTIIIITLSRALFDWGKKFNRINHGDAG